MNQPSLYNIPQYVMALTFIGIGLNVLINRRAMIISYKWFLFLILFMFATPLVQPFFFPSPFKISDLLPVLLLLLFISYFYFIMRGYMVIGADGDDFQKAIVETLQEENLEYEQTFTSVKIKEPALEISIAFQSWVGSGQIRLRSKDNIQTFDKIIGQLQTKIIKPNFIMPVFYILIGAFVLAMGII